MNGYHLDRSQDNIWVLGNGESRKNIDLDSLDGKIIGCNAVHRNCVCHEIVAVDRRMVLEITNNQSYKNIPIYTRSNWINQFKKHSNVRALPELPYKGEARWDDPWHWNSGPFAVLLACMQRPKVINLVGFDLYSSDGKINNIYKGSNNYDKADHHAIDFNHWVYQLKTLFDHYSDLSFFQWQKEKWTIPDLWKKSKNLTLRLLSV